MPELRRDPVVGFWTIISTERGWRPTDFHQKQLMDERVCPFCEGRESETTPEAFAIRKEHSAANGPGWSVRAIVSKQPILSMDAAQENRFGEGIYDLMEGIGRHEVIVESPRHKHDLDELDASEIENVIRVYTQRFNELEKDSRFKYVLLFKNHGLVSGSARDVIRHARSQIIGLPVTPKRVKEELEAARNYFERHDRCVFCDVLRQEIADVSRLVAQNQSFIAFCPFASRSPFEMWIMPRKHGADFGRLEPAAIPDFARILKECLARLKNLLDDHQFNFILHTAPYRHKKKGLYWKTIEEDTHWYLQIAPRLTRNAGFEWGTGIHINPTPPEDAAALLRESEWNHDASV